MVSIEVASTDGPISLSSERQVKFDRWKASRISWLTLPNWMARVDRNEPN